MENSKHTSRHTINVSRETAQRLRLIAAITGEKQYAVLTRIVEHEWHRVQGHLVLQPKETPHDA